MLFYALHTKYILLPCFHYGFTSKQIYFFYLYDMEQSYVIIVAAGTGSRIGGNLPKQFIPINGQPILMHTLLKFHLSETKPKIMLVLSSEMESYWKELCLEYDFQVPHEICHGGDSRFQSVKNGLAKLRSLIEVPANAIIAVHDAARPLLSTQLIDALYQEVGKGNHAVIPAVQSSSSVRFGNENKSEAVDRNQVWLVQTPQVFQADLLLKAYEQEELSSFTDDASVVENWNENKTSNNLLIFPGEHQNLKITYQEDLAIAQLLLE